MIFIATAPPHTQKIGAEDYEKKRISFYAEILIRRPLYNVPTVMQNMTYPSELHVRAHHHIRSVSMVDI